MRKVLAATVAVMAVAVAVYGLNDPYALRDRFSSADSALNDPAPKLMVMGRVRGPDGQPVVPHDVDMHSGPTGSTTEAPLQLTQADTGLPAQTPVQPPVTSPAAGSSQSSRPQVDESALRYFAARNDQARLQAEISRLRALYPDWTPPTDPLAVPQNGDSQLEGMWRLYADGRFAELRKAIADRRATDTAWQPPADLLERLDVAEARARLINASDLKQYQTVVEIGAGTSALLTCAEVDVLWRIAEAFAETERDGRARDAYNYVLKNCTNPQERLATVQKASAVLDYAGMQDLLSSEHRNEDGSGEFDGLRDDLSRRFVAEANENTEIRIAETYVERVEKLADEGKLASDALLVGWYRLRRDDTDAAEKWFRMARDREDSASASQGLALCLIAKKSPQEAEDVMYRWRDDSTNSKDTYMAATANLLAVMPPPVLTEPVLQRIAAEVIEAKDAASAQQFGWYARNFNQPQTAARWFETALSWKPDDEPSAYGLVLARNQLNDRAGVAAVQSQWQGRSVRIANLGETTEETLAAQRIAQAGVQTGVNQQAVQSPAQQYASQPAVNANAPQVITTQRPPTLPTYAPARVQQTLTAPVRRSAPAASPSRGVRTERGCTTTIDPEGLAPGAALSRGWCLMELNRPMEAADAFGVALKRGSGEVREDAAYGQSLAYLRVGLTDNAAVAATQAPLARKRASELQVAILSNRATAAFDAARYRDALLFLDQRAQLETERVDLMVMRGYAYLNIKRYGDAMQVFEAAAQTGNRDALRGLADVRAARNNDY
ncbi:cellulose synthase [Rhizobiales bacterium RZME27]|uniref:Cellulose synthase n=1 Tax=Endobacterium cereale TaxID=2663029 RepID=A0A6A8A7T8_9HYPH|nr:cellulose synthase [Endobacterium cereale]MEB2845145.1 cellulose synthase [Endobacterium cereale]MQY45917.1 cellulose synthase [Endobacterium cereale]